MAVAHDIAAPFADVFGHRRGEGFIPADIPAVLLNNTGETFWPLLQGPGYQIGELSPATERVAVGVMTHNEGHLWACAELYSRPDTGDEWRLRGGFETSAGALTQAVQHNETLNGQADSHRDAGEPLTDEKLLAAWLDSAFTGLVPRPEPDPWA